MATTRTRMLNIGDKVQYHGSTWGRGPDADHLLYCEDGDIAEVFEFHEAQPAIRGWVISRDEETGEPIYDEGIRAWVSVRFPNGLTAAVDGDGLQRGRWSRV